MSYFFSLEVSIEALRRLQDIPNLIEQEKLQWILAQYIPQLSSISENHLQATAIRVYPSTKNTHDITRVTVLHFGNDHHRCASFWRLLLNISATEHKKNEFICSTLVPSSNFIQPEYYTINALLKAIRRRHCKKMHLISLKLSDEEIMRQAMMLSQQESATNTPIINQRIHDNQENRGLALINANISNVVFSDANDFPVAMPGLDKLALDSNKKSNGWSNEPKDCNKNSNVWSNEPKGRSGNKRTRFESESSTNNVESYKKRKKIKETRSCNSCQAKSQK